MGRRYTAIIHISLSGYVEKSPGCELTSCGLMALISILLPLVSERRLNDLGVFKCSYAGANTKESVLIYSAV